MTDVDTTVAALRDRAVAFRDERDWRQFHTPKDLTLAIAAEAGELAEVFLWKTPEEVEAALAHPAQREHLSEEMADVLLYLLCLADVAGVDLSQAVEAKLAINAARYPVERSRGSARKYTDLT